jgi:anti-sigma B factor antagonist
MSDSIDLSVRVSPDDDAHVARVLIRGELDFSNASMLRARLRAVERRNPSVLVLDLADLSFMDVSGLRTILDAARRATRDERRLVVANPMPAIVRLFELTAIDQSLDVVRGPFVPVG